MDKSKPKIVQKAPIEKELQPGDHYWCACGHSKNQPFCDGSHNQEAPGLFPKRFELKEVTKVYLCACKQTKNPPFCDGTHNSL